MHFPAHEQKQAILEQAMRIADQSLPAAGAREARAFIAAYYEQVDAEDLAAREPADLYGAAMAHLAFARTFASGTPKLRVYNPREEEHGWASPHTVIEMVNDDMPFLVDSVTMEVNRQGCTLHLLNHPLYSTRRDAQGRLESFGPPGSDGHQESLIHVEVDREIDPARLKALADGLLAALGDVRAAWRDWADDARAHGCDREGARRAARLPRRRGNRRRSAPSSRGPRTTTSRSSATASTSSRRSRARTS